MAPVGLRQDVGKATANIIELFALPVHLFPCADDAFKNLVQLARSGKIRAVEVDMEHRIFRPPVSSRSIASPLNKSRFPSK